MMINLKPNERLAEKLARYSHGLSNMFTQGGRTDSGAVLVDLSTSIPRDLFEEVSMYVLAHDAVSQPAQVPEFGGTEFTISPAEGGFLIETCGGTCIGMSTLEAKQLAAWILDN